MTTGLESIRSKLAYFNPVSNSRKDIHAVLDLYVNAEQQRPKKK